LLFQTFEPLPVLFVLVGEVRRGAFRFLGHAALFLWGWASAIRPRRGEGRASDNRRALLPRSGTIRPRIPGICIIGFAEIDITVLRR
jgi:hypothetical protein